MKAATLTLISDPWFYAVAIPAVFLVGLSKGGFSGGTSLLGVPLMSLVISPVQAAGIMLPILVLMDVVAVSAYRRSFHAASLMVLIPAALTGIFIGYLTAAYVTDAHVRLIVGIVTLIFVLNHWLGTSASRPPAQPRVAAGWFWGMLSGFTSFVSHSGGPPIQMYMLPQRLEKFLMAGTMIILFAVMNAAKLVPYFMLGQFDRTNLMTSAALLPLAPIATYAGVRLVRVISQEVFYRIMYIAIFFVSLKLIYDGVYGAFFA